jgi:2'-5' RNA ligase/GNAT superfamily N-acetyltransferase
VSTEVDGLRRACGDGALGRVAPHLTLVPPVNVRDDRVRDALDVVRAAAARTRPFAVTLGPPATFAPASPVLYLRVAPVDAVTALRDAVFVPPLERRLTYDFVPHVTLAEEMLPASRLGAAVDALDGYTRDVTFDRVHVLEEEERVWSPIAEFAFGAPAVVGRGGLELRLEVASMLASEARAFESREWPLVDGVGAREPIAITAWRGDDVVGTATGWTRGDVGWLDALVVGAAVRGEGVGSHLLAAFESECAARGATQLALEAIEGSGATAFYVARGWRVDGTRLDRVLLTRTTA